MQQRGWLGLPLVLCSNEAAGVSPNLLQEDQEGQQVEEHNDNLEEHGGMGKGEEHGGIMEVLNDEINMTK